VTAAAIATAIHMMQMALTADQDPAERLDECCMLDAKW